MNRGFKVKEYRPSISKDETRKKNKETDSTKKDDLWHIIITLSIFILIMGVLILRLVVPTPTMSVAENRELQKMPQLTFNTVFFGTFTQKFEDFFADTFPFRDDLIEAGDYLSYIKCIPVKGVDTVIVAEANIMQSDEDFEMDDETYAEEDDFESETDTENEISQLSGGTSNASNIDELLMEELSEEKEGADSNAQINNSGDAEASGKYLMTDNAIYYQIGINPDIYSKWVNEVNNLAEELDGTQVIVMTPPNSYAFYAPKKYYLPECDQQQAMLDMNSLFTTRVRVANAYSFLMTDMYKYIYFRTDHHWTARGAYCGYLAYCNTLGIEPIDISAMEAKVYDKDFLGSYYKQLKATAKAKLIRNKPDYIEYFIPPAQCELTTYTNTNMQSGRTIPMFDLKLPSSTTNYYRIFLGGDYPCIKIETDNNNGRSILILKDSYANAFAPFLTANYETIYIVDFRDFNTKDRPSFSVKKFVSDNEVDELLLLLNFDFVNSSTYTKWYLRSFK